MTQTLELAAYPTITGVGGCLGEERLTNQGLVERYSLDSSDYHIRRLTGIEERHHAGEEVAPSVMGTAAGRIALERAGLDPEVIDYFTVSTTLGDHVTPSTASKVHGQLGLSKEVSGSFDISAACSGAVASYDAACAHMMAYGTDSSLVISSEILSRNINYDDRRTAILFGDGAGAVVMQQRVGANRPVFVSETVSDPDAIHVLAGLASEPAAMQDERRFIQMEGKRVRDHAMHMMPSVATRAAQKAGIWDHEQGRIDPEQLDLFVPHQANLTMIEPLAEFLGVPEEKQVKTVPFHGNTSSASIPLALNHAYESGQLKLDQLNRILMVAIGAGMVAKAGVMDVYISSEPRTA